MKHCIWIWFKPDNWLDYGLWKLEFILFYLLWIAAKVTPQRQQMPLTSGIPTPIAVQAMTSGSEFTTMADLSAMVTQTGASQLLLSQTQRSQAGTVVAATTGPALSTSLPAAAAALQAPGERWGALMMRCVTVRVMGHCLSVSVPETLLWSRCVLSWALKPVRQAHSSGPTDWAQARPLWLIAHYLPTNWTVNPVSQSHGTLCSNKLSSKPCLSFW